MFWGDRCLPIKKTAPEWSGDRVCHGYAVILALVAAGTLIIWLSSLIICR